MKIKPFKIALLAAAVSMLNFAVAGADMPVEQSGEFKETLHGQAIFEISGSTNLNGVIRIVSGQTSDITVKFIKWARASSEPEARRFLDLIDLELDVRGDERAILKILSPTHAPWEGTDWAVKLTVYVDLPEKMRIEGRCRFMDIDIFGPFEGVILNCEHSSVFLERIYGTVDVSTTYGDIQFLAIKGNVKAKTKHGAIDAHDIVISSGNAILQTEHDAIVLEDIQGPVEAYTTHDTIIANNINALDGSVVLRTDYAPIKVADIIGELICETAYSPITIANSSITHGHSRIETSYAPIKAQFYELANCELYISSDYSNVELIIPSQISAELVATVDKGGRIRTSDLNIRPTLLDPTRLEGLLGEGDAKIEVRVSGVGNIDIIGR